MKRKFFILSFGLLSVFLLSSCLDNDFVDYYVSYGVIQNVNSKNDYEILTDKGNTLVVTKSYSSQSIEEGKRVLVNYEILSDDKKNKKIYEVKVNIFYSLLAKPLIDESFILQNEEFYRDSIGNDPFNSISARFGGEYINIDFEVFHSQYSNKKHMINLVYDDLRADADTIYLSLYHNAYGEIPGKEQGLVLGYGKSSFKIADLLPEGVTSKHVRLTWTEYQSYGHDPKVYSKTGVFKLGNNDAQEEKSLTRDIGSGAYLEVN